MSAKIWKTPDGQKLHIVDMTDTHLVNTIRYLRRTFGPQKDVIALSMDSHPFDPDSAAAYLYSMTEDDFIEEICPQFKHLLNEATMRGLKP